MLILQILQQKTNFPFQSQASKRFKDGERRSGKDRQGRNLSIFRWCVPGQFLKRFGILIARVCLENEIIEFV
jgi:hypothetical protein